MGSACYDVAYVGLVEREEDRLWRQESRALWQEDILDRTSPQTLVGWR